MEISSSAEVPRWDTPIGEDGSPALSALAPPVVSVSSQEADLDAGQAPGPARFSSQEADLDVGEAPRKARSWMTAAKSWRGANSPLAGVASFLSRSPMAAVASRVKPVPLNVSMRAAVVAPRPMLRHSTSEGRSDLQEILVLPASFRVPRGPFSMRGSKPYTLNQGSSMMDTADPCASLLKPETLNREIMHAFVSYRVETEGPAGNALAEQIAQKIRVMSTKKTDLKIPEHGWGIWPKSAHKPVPFRPDEAKVRSPHPTLNASCARAQLTPLHSVCLGTRRLTAWFATLHA